MVSRKNNGAKIVILDGSQNRPFEKWPKMLLWCDFHSMLMKYSVKWTQFITYPITPKSFSNSSHLLVWTFKIHILKLFYLPWINYYSRMSTYTIHTLGNRRYRNSIPETLSLRCECNIVWINKKNMIGEWGRFVTIYTSSDFSFHIDPSQPRSQFCTNLFLLRLFTD